MAHSSTRTNGHVGASRFTMGGHKTPSHNPPQPHLGLAKGPHTDNAARRAVNEIHGVKESAPKRKPATQASLETPKAMASTRAKIQAGSKTKTSVKSDSMNADSKGFPKGKE